MTRITYLRFFAAGLLFASTGLLLAQAPAADPDTGNAHTIITVLPKKSNEPAPSVTAANVNAKVDGKETSVSSLSRFPNDGVDLQMVILIDDGARSSLGLYLKEISNFITALPQNTAVGVAYIENGAPHFVQPLTTDHAAAAGSLRLPGGPPGVSADPYFAVTSLSKNWPTGKPGVRREVVMVSDGVDPYYGLRYDPEDPYVQGATQAAQKRGVIVYSIYFKNRGFADRVGRGVNSGQNYLIQMSEATGGEMYYEGFSNPVSFVPFLNEIQHNLQNQYEVSLRVPPNVKDGLQTLKVKVNTPDSKLQSADHIFVGEQPVPEK